MATATTTLNYTFEFLAPDGTLIASEGGATATVIEFGYRDDWQGGFVPTSHTVEGIEIDAPDGSSLADIRDEGATRIVFANEDGDVLVERNITRAPIPSDDDVRLAIESDVLLTFGG